MLVEFSAANHRSFKRRVTLSLVATDTQNLEANVFESPDGLRLLRAAAIYGANASGKSNLINALRFVRQFVLSSFKETQAREPIPVNPFRLGAETENQPSEFEVVFYQGGSCYRYGFSVDARHVQEEWLFRGRGAGEEELFQRSAAADSSIEVRPGFGLNKTFKTRENALFLSTAAQNSGETDLASILVDWFRDLRLVSGLIDNAGMTMEKLLSSGADHQLLDLARLADPTLRGIRAEPPDARFLDGLSEELKREMRFAKVTTIRERFDEAGNSIGTAELPWNAESEGTRKFISLSVPLLGALQESRVMVVDELDARFHPLLTRAIIQMFLEAGQDAHAQLVFATHDTNLLDRRLLRKDQIWFTEKDGTSSTDLYSLEEVRLQSDAVYEQDYIQGRYGAIPFLRASTFVTKAGA